MPEIRFAGRIGFVIAWFLLIGAGLGTGQAATVIFTGPNLGTWNDPNNWMGGVRPTDGDDVVISPVAGAGSTNDIAGLDLRTIQFDVNHIVSGNALTVSHGVIGNAGLARLSTPVTLNGDQEWSGSLLIDQLAIAGYTLTTTGPSTTNSLQVTTLS